MTALVDLHLHLLPGVDDGPPTLEAAVEHAHAVAAGGVREAVVTPHVGHPDFPVDVEEITGRTARLQEALRMAGIDLRLRPGGELHATAPARLTQGELELVAHGPPGRRWVLLEPPWAGVDDDFLDACADLFGRGFGILLAHPERSAGFAGDGLERVRPLLGRGLLLQVNVCSLLGRHGQSPRDGAARLLRAGLTSVLASDGHGGDRRHTLAAGPGQAERVGLHPVAARGLVTLRPARLLAEGIRRRAPLHALVTG